MVNLFAMAQNFEHLVFEECKFSNQFNAKIERSNTGRLRRVSFLGPQIPESSTLNFVKNVILQIKSIEEIECGNLNSGALELLSENEISSVFKISKLLRSGKSLFP